MDIILDSLVRNRSADRVLLGKEQEMTREEAIEVLKLVDENVSCDDCLYYAQMEDCPTDEDCIIVQAVRMAKQALSQEPCDKEYETYCSHKCNKCVDNECPLREQEPCEDVISREAVLKLMDEYNSASVRQFGRPIIGIASMRTDVRELPPVTQKSGKWDISCTCSVCGRWRILESEKNGGKYKFCPNCGARMVEPQESEG